MRYALALLTHGEGRTVRRCVESFVENVTPRPSAVVVFGDAIHDANPAVAVAAETFKPVPLFAGVSHPSRQAGFCGATARLWENASKLPDIDYVFWLEHDFVFLRPVTLETLAALLDSDPGLAQVSLIRDAVNAKEARAGGVIAARPGEFAPRRTESGHDWLEQRSYFTTNPSLMRRAFMEEQPFIDDGAYCEGRYGIRLIEQGYRFAAWGDGSEWVAHMGIRDASGTGY